MSKISFCSINHKMPSHLLINSFIYSTNDPRGYADSPTSGKGRRFGYVHGSTALVQPFWNQKCNGWHSYPPIIFTSCYTHELWSIYHVARFCMCNVVCIHLEKINLIMNCKRHQTTLSHGRANIKNSVHIQNNINMQLWLLSIYLVPVIWNTAWTW